MKMNFFKFFTFTNVTKDVEGFANLQKRINDKSNFLESAFHSFSDLNKSLKDFLKQVISYNTKFTSILKSPEEQPLHETCKLIYQKLINDLEQDSLVIDEYKTNLNNLLTQFNKEKNVYENLKKINKDLEDEKIKLIKNRDTYFKVARDAEKKIKNFVQNNMQNLQNIPPELKTELINITSNPIKCYDNYITSISKVNDLVVQFNSTQNYIFNSLPELGNEDGVFFFRLVKLYFQCLENCENYLNSNKKQMTSSKTVETNSALKILIEENDNKKRYEKKINLVQYQSDINFYNCKNRNEFEICANMTDIINKYINKNIFKDYDYNKELKNYEEAILVKKLFEEKDELNKEIANNFLASLNDPSLYYAVIIVLSQLRTNNKVNKSKSLIKCLGKGFNKILDYAEKNKIYDYAKNCIILSQTYYYTESDEKEKIYLSEMIKNNKWLTSQQFWKEFIDYMIKLEFERLESDLNLPSLSSNKKINMTNEIKSRFNEVVFSQLLAYITNMIYFIPDKKIVLKISDEFIKKYDYLSNENLNTLFSIISQDKEEIEKLRNEYNQNKDNIKEKDSLNEDKINEENQEKKEENEKKEEKEEKEENKKKD